MKNKIIPNMYDTENDLYCPKHITDAVPKNIIGVEVIVYKYIMLFFLLINKVIKDTTSNIKERQEGINAYSSTLALIPNY